MATTAHSTSNMPTSHTGQKTVSWPFPVDFLKQHNVENVLDARRMNRPQLAAHPELARIEETDTVERAMEKLRDDQIRCLPVYRRRGDQNNIIEYCNMLDVCSLASSTILKSMCDALSNQQLENFKKMDETRSLEKVLHDCWDKNLNRTIMELVQENPSAFQLRYVQRVTSIYEVARHIVQGRHHHFLVAPEEGRPADILSEGDITAWLSSKQNEDPALREALSSSVDSVSDIALQFEENADPNQLKLPNERWTAGNRRYALHMPETVTAITAFRTMVIHHFPSVAIVNKMGKFVGNLSGSDLRHLTRENIQDLYENVMTYLAKSSIHSKAPVSVRRDTIVGEALQICTKHNIHRVWEVDSDGKLIGSFSLTDALCNIMPKEIEKEE
ncbi:hypothetical protein DFS34DRAFT_689627 [Phlyctochytrium arcticum]|nr:hypothetical protein DFS34DRAFT_689627 [Phlyctochytrium arcticum]